MKRTFSLARISIYVGALISTGAAAQADNADFFDMPLEELLKVEVSIASTSPEAIITAPATISFFTQERLTRLGVTKLHQLYRFIPGFYSAFNASEDNQSYISVRGQAQKYASTVLFLYNGQRINDDYSGGLTYFFRQFDLSNVERIEVIRGPGSATYGANAFNAVINIITKTENELSVSTGNELTLDGNLGLTYQVDDVKLALNLNHYDHDGQNYDNAFDRLGRQTATSDPQTASQIEASAAYQNFTWRYLFQQNSRDNFYLYNNLYDGLNRVDLTNHVHQLEYKLIDTGRFGLNLSAQYSNNQRESMGVQALKGMPGFVEDDVLFGFNMEHRSLQFNASSYFLFEGGSRLSYGASYQRSQVPEAFFISNYDIFSDLSYLNELRYFDERELQTVSDKTREISSIYGQYNLQVTADLNLSAGLRHDHYNDITSAWSPRIAAVYNITPKSVVKLLYNEAFRVPSIGDLYEDQSNISPGSSDVETAELQSLELSYNYVDDRYFVSITVFENDVSNLIGFTNEQRASVTNISHNLSRGIELDSQIQLSPNINLMLAYTNMLSNKSTAILNEKGVLSENMSPDQYANISFDFNVTSALSVNVQANWRDQIQLLQDDSSLWLFDGLINYQLSKRSLLQLQFHNLTDKTYYHPYAQALGSDENGIVQQVPARGREIEFGWRYSF